MDRPHLFVVDQSKKTKCRYRPTPEIDLVIREAYRRQRQGDRNALKNASLRLGWSRNAICKRGAALGITRVKEKPWTPGEEELLERFGHLSPAGLQRRFSASGFVRSVAAIKVKLNRSRIKQNLDGYSACRLADAFGVDVHKV